MSSMIEGSDDRAREDELDLGEEDEGDVQPKTNGASVDGVSPEGYGEGSMAYIEEDLPDVASPNHSFDRRNTQLDAGTGNIPLSPHIRQLGTPGSVDETASTPDDTPSLHVCCDCCFQPCYPLITLGFSFVIAK
ncbi:hypothetical protein BDV37DRAFT_249195 [Aspergillus pseudonomiae]|uniref:Uncharacterized protein n=1 Tax=Aspergillus pseudonomiae TaxID=1506151 RepID=A0A5N7DBA6_9EURO|nr:uncharacterized protein BDV37DRAFT_249195 [Aspergillus pseudonomiae]KAE8403750.1 hypothetical protein BDV37DRAFT_249195 [Aspergillus pseudonomiae]